jgi:redox-sensitive bicupin YhaK (pirin superfamily)
VRIRPADERGHADHGWLDARHSFSFAGYDDPRHRGFRSLRVINEDRIAPGRGFPPHPHRDTEILTWVLSGSLRHGDDMGNGSVIHTGEIQRMTAGTGVVHSERNASDTESLHLLQIWLLPDRDGHEPGWEQVEIPLAERTGALRCIASSEGAPGEVRIHQDASVFATTLLAGANVEHVLGEGRHAWIQVTHGRLLANGETLVAGDGAATSEPGPLRLEGIEEASLLLFDLA